MDRSSSSVLRNIYLLLLFRFCLHKSFFLLCRRYRSGTPRDKHRRHLVETISVVVAVASRLTLTTFPSDRKTDRIPRSSSSSSVRRRSADLNAAAAAMGRKKIQISRITDERNRQVTCAWTDVHGYSSVILADGRLIYIFFFIHPFSFRVPSITRTNTYACDLRYYSKTSNNKRTFLT